MGGGRRRGARAARERVALDPVARFREWFEAARAAGTEVPEAMTLATADAEGRPSARMVLLKSADERGFTFFTGYESRKGRELAENPRGALVFYWRELGRQVRVEGPVRRLPAEESDAYWQTRPVRSRAAAAASRQSEPIDSRAELEAEFERQVALGDPQRPERWGGYVLEPEAIELWQHRDDRLHERTRYTRARDGWRQELLAP
jgi:pyridoxamine 5'-phosphate oxidase